MSRRRDVQLPWSEEAELAVLGALVIDAEAAARVFDRLTTDDFYSKRHRRVFSAAHKLWKEGQTIDPVTLSEELTRRGELEKTGGMMFLAELLDVVPTAANVDYHVRIVADHATRRRLWEAGRATAEEAIRATDAPLDDVLDRAERRILQVADSRTAEGPRRVQDTIWDAMGVIERGGVPGVPCGLADVDAMTGGWKPGNLIIVAGATSMGKSAFALAAAAHAAIERRVPTAIFSIEMTKVENTIRLLSLESLIDLSRLMDGKIEDHEYQRLRDAAARIHSAPLFLDDTATRVSEIRARARRLKVEHRLGLIVVDHIHDMEGEGEERREQIGAIGRGLKQMAKELDVPVIAVSQLSRAPTTRSDCRPRLSDLRESGDLEAVANVVVLMYRPEYYFGPKQGDKDLRGLAEAIVAKNRNGPTGRVDLYFRAECARFESLAREDMRGVA